MLSFECASLYLIFRGWLGRLRTCARCQPALGGSSAGWRHIRASLINMPLSELNADWGRLMLHGAARGLKVTSCVLITQHPWPLEGNTVEWAYYILVAGHQSLPASKWRLFLWADRDSEWMGEREIEKNRMLSFWHMRKKEMNCGI